MKKPKISIQSRHRDRAAVSVLARLKRDQERAEDDGVQRFLEYLSRRLFDSEMSLSEAYTECALEQSFATTFRSVIGQNPKQYIQKLRIDVGVRLTEDTSLSFDVIAAEIGMSSGSSFSHAFLRATGKRPAEYRSNWQKTDTEERLFGHDLGRRICDGHLKPEELGVLYSRLRELYPHAETRRELSFHAGGDEGHPFSVSQTELDRLNAEALWMSIEYLKESEQRQQIRNAVHIKSSALFEFLRAKTTEVGRQDRSQAVTVARLALIAAMTCEDLDTSCYSNLWARGWAWLGNAQRLNLELGEADRSFALSELYLSDAEPKIRGEIFHLKGLLRMEQRIIKEGLECEDHAILLLTEANDEQTLASAYLAKALLLEHDSRLEEAAQVYHANMALFRGAHYETTVAALYNLARCYWMMGKYDKSSEFVAPLKRQTTKRGLKFHRLYIDWLEGRLQLEEGSYEKATDTLGNVHSRFLLVGSSLSALVGLDLAIAYISLKHNDEAVQLASEALPFLYSMRELPGFEEAISKLERAVNTEVVLVKDLLEVRALCDPLGREPSTRSLLRLRGMV